MSFVEKAQWYRHRLASMSGPEILHRLAEAARRKSDRTRGERWVPTASSGRVAPVLPGLKPALLAWDVPLALLAEWNEHAEQARNGRYVLLGHDWPGVTDASKWHLDPATKTLWPDDRYCFAIDFRHQDEKGDVKYVWELGRLQFLQPIAALALKTGDADLASFCLSEIESWIDANPPHLGVHWASGIELGLRVVSILVVSSLLDAWLSPALAAKIAASLEAHGFWLARYPSKFSSANNHQTAEGLGLFLLGACLPDCAEAARWRHDGWNILCEAARLQILPDGVGAEQTPNYTAIVLEMLLLGRHVALAKGMPIPDVYDERLQLGGEYLRWFTDEGGHQPQIGDNDNARILGAYRRDETYVRSILGALAATFNRPDLTPPQETPHFRQALFGFAPKKTSELLGVRHFEQGGYTVGRHAIGGQKMMLAIDHGPLGYLSIAAHGHADALSVWMHLGDQPILVDSGTYLYHSGGSWRRYFRSTAAHNTLSIEDADSSRMSGNFNWSHKAAARMLASGSVGEGWWIEAEHDGYVKQFAAIHRRRLDFDPRIGVTIEDRLLGGVPRRVAIRFLLHPALETQPEDGGLRIAKAGTPVLHLHHRGPLALGVGHAGSENGGWHSPTFGEKQPATVIHLTGMLSPDEKVSTKFTIPA